MEDNLKYGTDTWWTAQIQRGLAWRKKNAWENRWEHIRRYYENRFENALDPHFNLIYMLSSSIVPALVFQRPSIVNTARRPEFNYWASFFDGIDNWLLEEMEMKELVEEAVLEAFLYNTVGFQLGYDFPSKDLTGDAEITFDRVKGTLDRTRKTNQPWIDLLPCDRLILAPGTKNGRNCRWFAKFLSMPIRRLKQVEGFKSVEATHVPDEIAKQEGNKWIEEEVAEEGYVNFYEIHDAETEKWGCIDTNGKFILKMQEDPLQVDGLPLEVLSFNHSTKCLWGTPDSLYIETQMLEGDECRKDGRAQRKIALVKFLYDAGVVKKEDIEKIISGGAGIGIGCDLGPNSEGALSNKIAMLQPHVQQEYYEYNKQLLNDAQLLTGTGPNQFGTFAPGRRTRYETQVVEERNLLRTGSRRQKLADLIGRLVGRMNQLIVKNWKAPIVAKVVGIEGSIHWVKALPSEFSELRAQITTSVNVESMTPVSKDRMRQEMVELMNILKGVQGADIMPLVQSFLSTFSWADVTKSLPQATNGTVGISDFAAQQGQMQKNPDVNQMAMRNLSSMGSVINKMPNVGGVPGGAANEG